MPGDAARPARHEGGPAGRIGAGSRLQAAAPAVDSQHVARYPGRAGVQQARSTRISARAGAASASRPLTWAEVSITCQACGGDLQPKSA